MYNGAKDTQQQLTTEFFQYGCNVSQTNYIPGLNRQPPIIPGLNLLLYQVGKQGVAAPVSSRLVCQPCFICQLLHHCVNASLLLYQDSGTAVLHISAFASLCKRQPTY
jgi:hypothetical protein